MQQSNLNLIPSGDMPVIYASQYDKNRVIRFNLFDGDDEYTLTGTEIVKCNIRKNDEHIVVIVPTIGNNTYIDVALTEQACACFGDNIGEITISDDADTLIGTINFILKVERNPIQGGVTSASDIADLETQIEEIVHEVMSDDYYTRDEVDAKLDLKANADDVYTKAEVDTALASKANAADVYTKAQVDTALGLKADKADTYTKTQVDTALALKADSSSVYTKSEVDTALAAKANAADVYTKTEVDEIIEGLYPVNTASGSIANFTTSLELPLVAMSAEIVAQQAGTGTPSPSNPRPISGFSSVTLTQKDSEDITIDTFTISLGDTYYGGEIDLKNGKLKVTHVYFYFDGNDSLTYYLSSSTATTATIGVGSFMEDLPSDVRNHMVSNRFSPTYNSGIIGRCSALYAGDGWRFYFIIDINELSSLDASGVQAWFTNNLTQVICPLATPIEITGLTPANFTTFAGENNIFADCGDVSVSFKQGIQEYIDSKIGG